MYSNTQNCLQTVHLDVSCLIKPMNHDELRNSLYLIRINTSQFVCECAKVLTRGGLVSNHEKLLGRLGQGQAEVPEFLG